MKNPLKFLILPFIFLSFFAQSQTSFYASTSSGCAPLAVNFINTSSSGVHFNWYFGDGGYLNDTYNASHVFTSDGSYTITVDAYDASYFYLGSYSVNVDVTGPPNAIGISPEIACANDEVSIYTWADSPTYNWDFGDGTTESSTNSGTEHAYTAPGIYYITLDIQTTCGPYTVVDSVVVTNTATYFTGYPYMGTSPNNVCPGSNVYGYCSTGFQSYAWDFDNGNGGTNSDEQFSYPSVGTYNPSVTITNGCGVDTVLFQTIVVDNSIPVDPITLNGPSQVCLDNNFSMDAYSSNATNYTWDFGDGSPTESGSYYAYHSYASPGTYTVTVTAENDCGNTATETLVITSSATAPILDGNLDIYPNVICPGDEINYWVPDYDYYIDFGDGFGQSSGYTHSFDNVGTYDVTVILQNACGSTTSITETVTVQNNLPVNSSVYMDIYENPSCPNTPVEFSSSNGFSDYHWTFGDGFSSDEAQISHPYTATGNYPVSLHITNGCGNDTTLFSSVQIQSNLPIMYMDYDIYGNSICNNDILYMSASPQNGLTYLWNFGDGTTSTSNFANHIYGTSGNYTLTLTATNGCGNDSTISTVIHVGNDVFPSASTIDFEVQSPGCIGDNLYFAVIPAGLGSYVWDFGDGNSGMSDQEIFVEGQPIAVGFHAYNAPGTYNALLTVTNGCGNTFDTLVPVTVGTVGDNVPLDVFFWYNDSEPTCQGLPVTFQSVGAGTYIWDFGDGTGSLITYNSFTPVTHIYEDAGSYTVNVTGYNQCGNSDQNDENIFIPDSKITIITNTVQNSDCGVNNGVAIVSATGGSQPYIYSWTNGDNSVIADSLGSGIYTVTVTDINGCHNENIAAVSDDQGPVILLDNIQHNQCYGQNNGVISVSIFGGAPPYIISWSNGAVTDDIFNLVAGPYEIFVTDANGCFAAKSFTINQPQESIVSIFTEPADCGSNNGTATASLSNGVGPFNYIWPNGSGASNQTAGLTPGIHTLLVIDGNTCLWQANFAINETNAPIIILDSISDASCSGALSAVYVNTIGGSAPFTYVWSNGATTQDLTGVLPGSYSVHVEGSNGCSAYMPFELEMSVPEKPEICIVTVDTLTNSNIVVWSPVMSPDVVSYNIYKESSMSGLYYLVNNQSADSISQYYDYLSNPAIKSWRYKIAAVDNCGNESELSAPHKTIHLTSNLGVGGVVNLIWDHYNGFSYSTYYINRYHPTTGWMVIDSVGSSAISYTDLTPPSDSNLVYVVAIYPPSVCTATKAQDHNSSRSNKSGINLPDPGNLDVVKNDDATLSLYPNPTTGMIRINYTHVINEVRIYDLSGKLIYTNFTNTTSQINIDCSTFANGVYTVQLTTNGGLIYSKLVKQ